MCVCRESGNCKSLILQDKSNIEIVLFPVMLYERHQAKRGLNVIFIEFSSLDFL